MKKIFVSWTTILLVAVVSVGLVSCGGDVHDDPVLPGVTPDVSPGVSSAQKRLKSITYDNDEVGAIKYDNAGRISQVSIDGEEDYLFTYSNDAITINDIGKFTLVGGKITSGVSAWDTSIDFIYEGDNWTSYVQYYDDGQLRQTNSMEWKDGNMVAFNERTASGKTNDAVITYYDEQAAPIVHALFNFAPFVYGYPTVEDLLQDGFGFLYQYVGNTPKNLVKTISTVETEYDGRNVYTYTYNFEYIRNEDNDVVKVLLTDKRGDVTTYTLEWEDDATKDN